MGEYVMKAKWKSTEQGTHSLQQTISAGKEMAALAVGHPRKVDPKEIARQLVKNPKVQRTTMLAGGALAAAAIGKTIAQYTFYQTVVSREIKKSLKPLCKQIDELQTSVDELSRQCDQMQKQLAQHKGGGRKEKE